MFADRKTSRRANETAVAPRATCWSAASPSKTPDGVFAENAKPVLTCVLSSRGSWENGFTQHG